MLDKHLRKYCINLDKTLRNLTYSCHKTLECQSGVDRCTHLNCWCSLTMVITEFHALLERLCVALVGTVRAMQPTMQNDHCTVYTAGPVQVWLPCTSLHGTSQVSRSNTYHWLKPSTATTWTSWLLWRSSTSLMSMLQCGYWLHQCCWHANMPELFPSLITSRFQAACDLSQFQHSYMRVKLVEIVVTITTFKILLSSFQYLQVCMVLSPQPIDLDSCLHLLFSISPLSWKHLVHITANWSWQVV